MDFGCHGLRVPCAYRSTQFRAINSGRGCHKLRRKSELTKFSISEAKARAYDLRSGLAHGQQLGGFVGPDREIYDRMESVLRGAILRSMEDEEFANTLNDDQKIRERWPIEQSRSFI